MKTKKTLSLLLCLVMLISMMAGTGAFSLSAATEASANATVSFRSPAILANVGDKIDLSKYGVEFAEGVKTTEGLTWWKEGVSGLSVSYANPAIFANVGDTVNFTNYDVELTKGNTVKADKLTWTQTVTRKMIPAATPYLQVEAAGEKIDLNCWGVEGMGSNLSWTLNGKAVTEIIASTGDVLTVSDGTTTKDVIVATKSISKYIVYENGFEASADLDRITRSPSFGATADLFPFTIEDVDGNGVLHADRSSSYTNSSQQNASFTLPEYLWGLSDYTIEWKGSLLDYISTQDGSTSFASSAAIDFFLNGDMTEGAWAHHMVRYTRYNNLNFYTREYAAKYADSLKYEKKYASVMSNFSKNGWIRFRVDVAGGTSVTTYYDYSSTTNGYSGTYSKLKEYDFAAVSGQTHLATNGAMGISFYRSDWNLDDIKVTVAAIDYTTQEVSVPFVTYTPAKKGVEVFNVSDGVNTHTVCVVAKNAEDTEYVLYENDFEDEGDFEELVRTTAFGADATLYPYSLVDLDGNKVFSTDRDYSSSTSSQQNASVALPSYLSNFSDYTIEWKGSVTDYTDARDGSTSTTFTQWSDSRRR